MLAKTAKKTHADRHFSGLMKAIILPRMDSLPPIYHKVFLRAARRRTASDDRYFHRLAQPAPLAINRTKQNTIPIHLNLAVNSFSF